MVIATLIALASISATPLGVVRVVHGKVSSGAQPALTGSLIASGAQLETGPSGWAELYLHGVGRVRLSAGTRAVFTDDAIALDSGRVWVQRSESLGRMYFEVQLDGARCAIGRGASVVVEHTRRAGTVVFVRTGEATIASRSKGAEPLVVPARHVSMMAPGAAAPGPARTGGTGIEDLVELETDGGLHDAAGTRAFLLERAAKVDVVRFDPKDTQQIFRAEPDLAGGAPASFALEQAIKPPPFFEEEVPPKGPNVRVEVTFSEE